MWRRVFLHRYGGWPDGKWMVGYLDESGSGVVGTPSLRRLAATCVLTARGMYGRAERREDADEKPDITLQIVARPPVRDGAEISFDVIHQPHIPQEGEEEEGGFKTLVVQYAPLPPEQVEELFNHLRELGRVESDDELRGITD